MDFTTLVGTVRRDPEGYLTELHPMALEGLLSGYSCVDGRVSELLVQLSAEMGEPQSTAPVFMKVHLTLDDRSAIDAVLGRIQQRLTTLPIGPVRDCGARSLVLRAIREGRPGMILGEPTVSWLANFLNGYLLALDHADPDAAARERDAMTAFAARVNERYGTATVPWWKLLRVFEGPCESGLRAFASYW